jgi:hypothetical protein
MILKILILVCCAVIVAGCPYLKTKRTAYTKSYTMNVEEQASTGVPMLSSGYTKYAKTYAKHALSEEQDNWRSFEYQTRDVFREELIYKGREDDQLYFSYKRYTRTHSSPASSDELIHDLKSSDIMLFRNYKIKVLNATREYIRFLVLDD